MAAHSLLPDLGCSFLQNKRVLITGALGGIGQHLVRMFYDQGAHVILSGLCADKLKDAQKTYPRSSILAMDLSCSTSIQHAMDQCLDDGPIDIVINNGGMTRDNLAVRMTDEEWNTVIQVNLTSAFQICRSALKTMPRHCGRIINIASIVGCTGNIGQANYSASKAGLIALTKTLALEYARKNITVNAIAPGFIDTHMTQVLPEKAVQDMLKKIPFNRYGTPEEVAFSALFLAHPLSGYITGQTLHVNGGMTMI
jgi:3-oxoacyl-[acyl-carrier protein] reductase